MVYNKEWPSLGTKDHVKIKIKISCLWGPANHICGHSWNSVNVIETTGLENGPTLWLKTGACQITQALASVVII
jgi:hypothetical protein